MLSFLAVELFRSQVRHPMAEELGPPKLASVLLSLVLSGRGHNPPIKHSYSPDAAFQRG